MLTCGSRSEGGHAYGRASARDRERETKSSLGSDRVVVVGLLEGVEEEQEEEGGELRAMPAQRSAAAARRRASFTSAKCTSTCFSPPTEEPKKKKEEEKKSSVFSSSSSSLWPCHCRSLDARSLGRSVVVFSFLPSFPRFATCRLHLERFPSVRPASTMVHSRPSTVYVERVMFRRTIVYTNVVQGYTGDLTLHL